MPPFLVTRPFSLTFNPNHGSGAKRMTFGKNGEILEGGNNNETTWRLDGTKLAFINSEGAVYSRFNFEPSTLGFVNAQDPDTIAKTIQMMTPAEVQGYE